MQSISKASLICLCFSFPLPLFQFWPPVSEFSRTQFTRVLLNQKGVIFQGVRSILKLHFLTSSYLCSLHSLWNNLRSELKNRFQCFASKQPLSRWCTSVTMWVYLQRSWWLFWRNDICLVSLYSRYSSTCRIKDLTNTLSVYAPFADDICEVLTDYRAFPIWTHLPTWENYKLQLTFKISDKEKLW